MLRNIFDEYSLVLFFSFLLRLMIPVYDISGSQNLSIITVALVIVEQTA